MDKHRSQGVSKKIKYVLLLGLFLSVMVSGIINYLQIQKNIFHLAKDQAEMAYQKDLMYRRWNSMNGGVYVKVTEQNKPNKYLKVENREITDKTGTEYTLINPAYMTRQVYEVSKKQYSIIGHMTSLNPINPKNQPDEWERSGLASFESGQSEAYEIVNINGKDLFRLIRPFITEESCLKCHAEQGYKAGDVRGGISIAIPMEGFYAIANSQIPGLLGGHLAFLIFGFFVIHFSFRKLNVYQNSLVISQQKLFIANKTKEKFFSIISHDLKNPFMSINGGLELLSAEYNSLNENEKQQLINEISKSSKNVYNLVLNLLSWSKSQMEGINLSKEKLNVMELIENSIEPLLEIAKLKNITLKVEASGESSLFGDKFTLQTVIRNLVSNAIKYSYRGKDIIIKHEPDQNYERITVIDSGVGIEKNSAEKLFSENYNNSTYGTENERGTGLGLALCKEFIEMNGGNIKVESEPGNGSKFIISIPFNS